jgi:hypothetical protein
VILLFPDGRPPGRWRWVWAAYVALVVAYTSLLTANAAEAIARGHIQVDSSGQLTIFDHSSAYGGIAVALAAVSVFLGFCVAAVGYQVACWRRSTGDRRQQMKWFASGAAVTFVCVSISASLPFGSALSDVLILGSSATAVGMGVGIHTYRPWARTGPGLGPADNRLNKLKLLRRLSPQEVVIAPLRRLQDVHPVQHRPAPPVGDRGQHRLPRL